MFMGLWERYLQIYSEAISTHCEKPLGIISEPVNTISNLAFFVSVYLIFKLIRKNKIKSENLRKLPFLVILIGLGSTIYHGYNNPYALIADVLPIYFFILYSIFLLVGELTKNKILKFAVPLSLVTLQFIVFTSFPAFILDIPTTHIVNLLFILIVFGWSYKTLKRNSFPILLVIASYGLGILFRGFDLPICPLNNFGTHFLWHIFMALTAYLTVRVFVKLDLNRS